MGWRYWAAADETLFTQHFEMSRLRTSPIAIGRMELPSFLRSGMRLALPMKGAKLGRARPDRNKLIKAVRLSRKARDPA
jgi:hypothetical protein